MKTVLSFLFRSKPFQKRLAKFIVHPVTILALATVAAVWLTNYYQERAWVREQQLEAFKYRYHASLELVDELSEAMSRRVFGMNRVVWAVKGTGTGELDEVWEEYYESVVEWNAKLSVYEGRLDRYIGSEAADVFGSWTNAGIGTVEDGPTTIHGHFFTAHSRVRKLVDCVRDQCAEDEQLMLIQQSERSINDLSIAADAFLKACTETIYE